MSAAEPHDAFSFLPHIHALLTAMQYSSEPTQRTQQQHATALLAHLTRAHSLLATLPAIAVSSAEQRVEYDRLCEVRDRKRELLARYNIRMTGTGDGADAGQKQERAEEEGSMAMEVGT